MISGFVGHLVPTVPTATNGAVVVAPQTMKERWAVLKATVGTQWEQLKTTTKMGCAELNNCKKQMQKDYYLLNRDGRAFKRAARGMMKEVADDWKDTTTTTKRLKKEVANAASDNKKKLSGPWKNLMTLCRITLVLAVIWLLILFVRRVFHVH